MLLILVIKFVGCNFITGIWSRPRSESSYASFTIKVNLFLNVPLRVSKDKGTHSGRSGLPNTMLSPDIIQKLTPLLVAVATEF